MKRFLGKISLLVVLIASIVLGLNCLYMSRVVNFGTMGIHRNDSAFVKDVPYEIEVANFGNSHGYYGFNYEKLGDRYRCFNFSLPSQSMSYNYLIMDNYRDHFKLGGTVYLCMSYSTLFGKSEVDNPRFLSKNRRYYKFLDEKHIKKYEYNYDIYINYLPILIASPKDVLRNLTGKDVSSKDWWGVGTNSKDAKLHGDARTKGWIGIDHKKQFVNNEEIEATYKIIALCKELGIRPIMITTPYLAEYTNPILDNNREFYRLFYDEISKISKATGVQYIDYSFDSRFTNDYSAFFNTDHMNRVGAARFTDILFRDTFLIQ